MELYDKEFEGCKSIEMFGLPKLYYKTEIIRLEHLEFEDRPDIIEYMYRYFLGDEVNKIGYKSGLSALYDIQGTSQIPYVIEITSNNIECNREFKGDNLIIRVRKSDIIIDNKNYIILKLLDVIERYYDYFECNVERCIKEAVERYKIDYSNFEEYIESFSDRTQEVIRHVFA